MLNMLFLISLWLNAGHARLKPIGPERCTTAACREDGF